MSECPSEETFLTDGTKCKWGVNQETYECCMDPRVWTYLWITFGLTLALCFICLFAYIKCKQN